MEMIINDNQISYYENMIKDLKELIKLRKARNKKLEVDKSED